MDVGFGVDAIDDEVMLVKREPGPKSELDNDKTWDSATMSRAVAEISQVRVKRMAVMYLGRFGAN